MPQKIKIIKTKENLRNYIQEESKKRWLLNLMQYPDRILEEKKIRKKTERSELIIDFS